MQIWNFEHTLNTWNVLLCCKERYLLLVNCFISLLRYIKMVKKNFWYHIWFHNSPQCVVSANDKSQISYKFEFSCTLSSKGIWCCAARRYIYCCLTIFSYSLNIWGGLEELPIAYMILLWGTQHVISANNKH